MPRFFFDVHDSVERLDSDGVELSGMGAARQRASALVGQMLLDAPGRLWHDGELTIWVRDERGLQLFSIVVYVSSALVGSGRPSSPTE